MHNIILPLLASFVSANLILSNREGDNLILLPATSDGTLIVNNIDIIRQIEDIRNILADVESATSVISVDFRNAAESVAAAASSLANLNEISSRQFSNIDVR